MARATTTTMTLVVSPSPSSTFSLPPLSSSSLPLEYSSSSSFFPLRSSSSLSLPPLSSSSSFDFSTPYLSSSSSTRLGSFDPATSSSYSPWPTINLPLTTIFTPPPDCTQPVLSGVWASLGSDSNVPSLTDVFKFVSTCYPTSFALSGYSAVYSPGVCPSGFSKAEQREEATATFATCCPTNANLYFTSKYALCRSQMPASGVTLIDATSTYTAYNKYAIVVEPITVGWQSSDLPNLPGTAVVANKTLDPTAIAAISDNKPAMSSAAKAGVSVGAAAGVIAIVGSLVWIVMRLWRQKKQQQPPREVYRDTSFDTIGAQRQVEQRRGPSEMSSAEPLRPELESNSFTVYR